MSGAEVVGFLLGAIPLVVSAIEHYRDGLDPLIDYSHYRSTLKALRTRLRIEFYLYEGTVKRLLFSELSSNEADVLFPAADVPLETAPWGTREIEEKLRKKLGKQYQTFMDVVWEMEAVMKKLMNKLDIDFEGKVLHSPSSIESTDQLTLLFAHSPNGRLHPTPAPEMHMANDVPELDGSGGRFDGALEERRERDYFRASNDTTATLLPSSKTTRSLHLKQNHERNPS
jgi:hypothetical protein